jgi:hypothetical protein
VIWSNGQIVAGILTDKLPSIHACPQSEPYEKPVPQFLLLPDSSPNEKASFHHAVDAPRGRCVACCARVFACAGGVGHSGNSDYFQHLTLDSSSRHW